MKMQTSKHFMLWGSRTVLSVLLIFFHIAAFSQEEQDEFILQESEAIIINEGFEDLEFERYLNWDDAQQSLDYKNDQPERGKRSSNWDRATEDLDYSKDKARTKKKERNTSSYNSNYSSWDWLSESFKGLGSFLQVLAIILAIAGIGYAIYYFIGQPRNKQISKSGVEITWDNLDQFVEETELEQFLHEALRKNNWSQAVRVYFLMVMQQLSSNNAIKWAKDKTNRTYLLEMQRHPQLSAFQEATIAYEEVWYGNRSIDREGFSVLEQKFKLLLQKLT